MSSYGASYDLAARRKNATRESTATLKAWLSEHKKNPYPTKGEKIMLAIITKMTLTQVSTWFANARRRLKKENKMTWEPKNRNDDDDNDDDDDMSDAGGGVVDPPGSTNKRSASDSSAAAAAAGQTGNTTSSLYRLILIAPSLLLPYILFIKMWNECVIASAVCCSLYLKYCKLTAELYNARFDTQFLNDDAAFQEM